MKPEILGNLVSTLTKRFPAEIKSVWMTKPDERGKEDTIIFLLDDTKQVDSITTNEIKNETEKLVKDMKLKEKNDLIFYKLSDYWELIRHGSPVTFTEIREGLPIYDPSGFFIPLKKLLLEGRVPGTKEAMRNLIELAPSRLLRIEKIHYTNIVDNLSSAVVDSAQAVLMIVGVSPPTPKDVPKQLNIHLVKKKKLEPEYVKYYEDVMKAWKLLEHGKTKIIKPEDIDDLVEKTTQFVQRMERLIEKLEK